MSDSNGSSKDKPAPYDHPAGGWGALKASGRVALQQKTLVKGALTLLRVNQPDGFDCPGCAWPEPPGGHSSAFEFCENGVKAVTWEATGKRVTNDFFAEHAVTDLRQRSGHWLEDQGRLTSPMRYDATTDRYVPVSWDDAFALIGRHLRGLDDPNRAIFYTSGRTSNEAAFLYQLLARRFGTNNMPDCSNMCHESSGVALSEVIGVGKGTVTLDDFAKADCVFIVGQNPGTNHPRMLATLQKASKRGATIVTMNPLVERGLVEFLHPQQPVAMLTGRGTPITSLYFQPMIGGDLAALKGICKIVLERNAIDHAFIDGHTAGFHEFAEDVAHTEWSQIEAQSGLSRGDIQRAAEAYIRSENSIVCWAMGLTQHKHAVPTIQMIVNLLLLRGNIGKPGAGACPVRGHSNVQGDRTVGITERPPAALLEGLRKTFGFDPPTAHGHDTVDAINAMAEGRGNVFIGLGGNFAAATPDSAFTQDAMAKCDLTVHISTKLNRSHTVTGRDALILPCLGRTERDVQATGRQRVTVEDSMSMVHASVGKNAPASNDLLSEPAIIAGIAKATLDDGGGIDWDGMVADYGRIREKIGQTLPGLFHDYNARIEEPGGFYLGNPAHDRQWKTQASKALFTVHAIPDLNLPPGQLRLMTIRSHDQYNTTVYDNHDRYRGIHNGRQVIFLNADDLAERGLKYGDRVTIESHFPDNKPRVVAGFEAVSYDIPRGCAAGYFPELNPLVSVDSYADRSKTPTSKFIPITIKPASDSEA